MSQFTECYFLKSSEQNEAIHLLESAKLQGYVFPARDGWVAFVANTEPPFKFSEEIKALNEGILIHFINAEDHGWGFNICVKNQMVCSFFLGINDEMEMETEEFFEINRNTKKESFEQLMKEENGKFHVLDKYFDESAAIESIMDVNNFTNEMQLYFSDWVSYHYVDLENGVYEKYGEYENLVLSKVNIG